MSTTILLADDHPIVRQGLRALLQDEMDFHVVGEAQDGHEALDMLESFRPDVLVLDLMMPRLNGFEVTRQACRNSPRTRIVILSMYANEGYVLEALQAGAWAYVLKSATVDDLVRAIRETSVGHRYLSPPLSEYAIEAYIGKAEAASQSPHATLSAREREVLQLAAEGLTNAEIAKSLCISTRTAETHRSRLTHKLGLRNHTDLVRYALMNHFVPLEN